MIHQNVDQSPSHDVDNPTNKGPAMEGDRLITQETLAMSARLASSVTPERTFEENAEQAGELTNQQSSPLASDLITEAFVAWVPTKRIVNKQLITPDGKPQSSLPQIIHSESQAHQTASQHVSALMRALGLAHHWQRLLRDRRMASVKEIAKAEGLSVAQVNRVLRLTLLAPSIIEWLIRSNDLVLEDIMNRPWPSCWATQLRSVLPTDKNPCAPWDQQGRLKAG